MSKSQGEKIRNAESFGNVEPPHPPLPPFPSLPSYDLGSFTDDEDGSVCMVPVADILNHVTGKNNARLFYAKSSLQVRARLVGEACVCWNRSSVALTSRSALLTLKMLALCDIAAGEEVSLGRRGIFFKSSSAPLVLTFLFHHSPWSAPLQIFNTYGELDNIQLLQKHGFCEPEPTIFEELAIPAEELLSADDALKERKAEYVRHCRRHCRLHCRPPLLNVCRCYLSQVPGRARFCHRRGRHPADTLSA